MIVCSVFVGVSQAPPAAQVRETHESASDGEVLDVDVRIAALDGSPEKLEDSVSLCLLDTPGECLLLAQQSKYPSVPINSRDMTDA